MIRALLAFVAALTDLIGGQIQLNFDTPVTSVPHIKSGRLRALAITGIKRLATLPDVPTFAESGLPAYDFQLWFGVLAPAGTPRPIIEKLSAEIARILAMPDVKQQRPSRAWTPRTDHRPNSMRCCGPTTRASASSSGRRASRSSSARPPATP